VKSFFKDRGSARRHRLALIVVLIASSCATDLQASSPDYVSSSHAPCSYQKARLASREQHPRSITCLPESNVLKRKEERRDSIADASHFRKTFFQPDACSSVAESFALSVFRPDRLIELAGTPPPAVLC
jgi:hypothetical protein